MNWNSLGEFLAMGGYAPYVWGSVLVCFGALAAEAGMLRLRRRALLARLALRQRLANGNRRNAR